MVAVETALEEVAAQEAVDASIREERTRTAMPYQFVPTARNWPSTRHRTVSACQRMRRR